MQHYAFLVDDDISTAPARGSSRTGIEYWADPQMQRAGETNTEHGGRGMYF